MRGQTQTASAGGRWRGDGAAAWCWWWVAVVLLLGHLPSCARAGLLESNPGLAYNFYKNSCPSVDSIVRSVTWAQVAANPALPARLLRLHFHDCFVKVRPSVRAVLSVSVDLSFFHSFIQGQSSQSVGTKRTFVGFFTDDKAERCRTAVLKSTLSPRVLLLRGIRKHYGNTSSGWRAHRHMTGRRGKKRKYSTY
jgi:hypothetical protein